MSVTGLKFDSLPFLLAVPVAAMLLLLLLSRSRSELTPRRRAFSLLARATIVSLLLAAMAGPSWTQRAREETATVFLLDVSESMGSSLPEAVARVEAMSARCGRSALVVFAGGAEVARPMQDAPLRVPREWIDSAERRRSLRSERTDFAEALRTAETISRTRTRYVIVTDGRDPLDTMPTRPDTRVVTVPVSGQDVAVLGVRAPLAVRTGEPFDVRVDLESTSDGEVEAVLMADDADLRRERIRVTAGRNSVWIRNLQPRLAHGPHRLTVLVRSDGDAERRNNVAGRPLFVLGRPRVLLLEESAAGAAIAKMLETHEFEVKRVPVARLADETLSEYAAIVSAGLSAAAFGEKESNALREYVGNGGGFWLVPPPEPAAASEFAKSPISEWLPVEFDPTPPKVGTGEKKPKTDTTSDTGRTEKTSSATVALLLLVDKSGSMAGDKLELVKEACRVTADTLQPGDSIGVLAFDTKPHWVLDFTSPDRKEYIRDQIYRLLADGGTDIHPALVEGTRALLSDPRARTAGIKHVILFSDGDTRPADNYGQVTRMAEAGITLSTVCILLGDYEPVFMKELADLGKGRFRSTGSFSRIPKLFTDEARALLEEKRPPSTKKDERPPERNDKTDEKTEEPTAGSTVVPKILETHEILWEGLPKELPSLRAILGSKPRAGTRVPIGTDDARPVLALARLGLGRVAVWTSDLEGRWSADWLKWNESPKLFAHLVRHLSSAADSLEMSERIEIRPGHEATTIRIAPGAAGERLTLTRLQPQRTEIPLEPGPDGSLSGRFTVEEDPTTLLVSRENGGKQEILPLTLPRPYPAEYFPTPPVAGVGAEEIRPATHEIERRTPLALWLILAAVALLPFDVALRRLR